MHVAYDVLMIGENNYNVFKIEWQKCKKNDKQKKLILKYYIFLRLTSIEHNNNPFANYMVMDHFTCFEEYFLNYKIIME